MTRAETLKNAEEIVTNDRENQYGSPEDNFGLVAELWNAYLGHMVMITPDDVAVMQLLLKVARTATGNVKEDNYIDMAGYAACACELATKNEVVRDV